MRIISLGKRSGKTFLYEKELRHCLENTNKRELIDKIIQQERTQINQEIELKHLRDLLLDYEVQNTKLQQELVRLKVQAGEKIYEW